MTHPTDDELQDLAHSAYEEALSFGLSVDTFLRYFKGIRNRLATQAQDGTQLPKGSSLFPMKFTRQLASLLQTLVMSGVLKK